MKVPALILIDAVANDFASANISVSGVRHTVGICSLAKLGWLTASALLRASE